MTRAAAGTWKISRRTLLRGLGAAVSLPLLEVMSHRTAGAESESRQSRMAYLYFPNGVAEGAWQPEKVGPQQELLALNRWMKPLEPFRDDLLIPRNMWTPHGNGHVAGPATWLTGGSYDHRRIDAGGASADQMAARYLAKKTLLPSLELSLRGEGFFPTACPGTHCHGQIRKRRLPVIPSRVSSSIGCFVLAGAASPGSPYWTWCSQMHAVSKTA